MIFFWSLEFKIWPVFDFYQKFDFSISFFKAFFSSFFQVFFLLYHFIVHYFCSYVFFTSGTPISQIVISWIYFIGLKLFSHNVQLFLLHSLREISISLPFIKNLLWNILDKQRSIRYYLINISVSTSQLRKKKSLR